jgi:hypothetical protein
MHATVGRKVMQSRHYDRELLHIFPESRAHLLFVRHYLWCVYVEGRGAVKVHGLEMAIHHAKRNGAFAVFIVT